MLLDIQNRGQLAAGMTTFNPDCASLLKNRKDVGTVTEVFRLNHRAKAEALMKSLAGRAAIGHARWPVNAATPGWKPQRPPYPVEHLRENALGEAFIDYMRRWPDFVQE